MLLAKMELPFLLIAARETQMTHLLLWVMRRRTPFVHQPEFFCVLAGTLTVALVELCTNNLCNFLKNPIARSWFRDLLPLALASHSELA
jgi:hypothetical protein